ncbi:putative beta-lysine N-acetyltransferase [Desulfurivibrio alkaliphilus]|uniref:GCN5-related N-acetyltransferase n=1 Tax=Desulfurivibrio alkaliphilus (strain DSM 19089 / UNIQEM U267 / AHT2) TaxID=589865 RepID=D6Z0P1_DESAT|nr:putative beta-lysine N-acetyltransferase [Desulfurivibrio alkaliphilus]ADH85270.1 GCN5-related N-acetyltransferase [Desulfurivibrio alkaliphilus AHT 2]
MMNNLNVTADRPAVTTADQTMTLGRSLVQHGRASDRVYLMAVADQDMPDLLTTLDELARENRYGKIFAKVPARWRRQCVAAGYRVEAEVPGFYGGEENGLFLGKYLEKERRKTSEDADIQAVLELCRRAAEAPTQPGVAGENGSYQTRLCTRADTPAMAELFRRVFSSYPFPVHDPAFLRQTMNQQVVYAGAWQGEELAALASAEFSPQAAHAEMTDFATAPEHRRRQLAGRLLSKLEQEMSTRGIRVAYTIARAVSAGVNLTFAKAGYRHAGTLINNTQICGRIESMNIWYRRL